MTQTSPHPSRRAVARGALWLAPTAAVSIAAPAVAASLRKDPGINGWVNNTYRAGDCGGRSASIEVTSRLSGTGPDGAPFGLYIYDTDDVQSISGATITYWVLGDHDTRGDTAISWSTASGHSSCWSYQGRVGTATKPDGLTYTGYRWTYTCPIDPADTTTGSDGIKRVFLGDFHVVSNSFRQPSSVCGRLNFWTERSVVIDGETMTFQRRAGTDGAYSSSSPRQARAASPDSTDSTDSESTSTAAS